MPRPGDDPTPYWTVDDTSSDAHTNYELATSIAVATALERRRLPPEVEQQIMTYARPTLPRDTADELERVWAAARDVAERGRRGGRRRAVVLGDRDDVGDLHDAGLDALEVVAAGGGQEEEDGVGDVVDRELALADADGLDEDDVVACVEINHRFGTSRPNFEIL